MPQIKSFQIDTAELGQDTDLQSNILHDNISGAGANTHATIDTHIADSTIHLTGSPPSLAATNISYDNTSSGLSSVNVQEGVDDLKLITRFKNTTHTGIISGGLMTNPTGTTIDISDGAGAIVDQVATPGSATGTLITWTGLTGITLSQDVSGFGVTHIFIDNVGTVLQFLTKPPAQTYIDNINLGVVYYEASAITTVFSAPDVVDSTAVNLNDYIDFQSRNNLHGVTPIAIGAGDPNSVLEFYITDGNYWNTGANWHTDKYNPNVIPIAANGTDTTGAIPWGAGAIFEYILGDGTVFATTQTILDETVYDDGTSVPGTVPDGDGLIQFIIEIPGGKTYVQPHTVVYRDWKAANSSLQSALSNFVKADEIKEGVIVGAYIGESDNNDWERGDKSSITSVAGSGAGGSAQASTEYYIDLTTGTGSPLGITETALPSGWTTTYNSVGNFTITHTLGDTTVGFGIVVLYNGGARIINPITITTNTIIFQIADMADAAVEGNLVGKLLF